MTGNKKVTVATGQQERIPLRFDLPATLAPGQYELSATVTFSNGENQQDSFAIDVLPRPAPVPEPRSSGRESAHSTAGHNHLPTSPATQAEATCPTAKIALFDPKGETGVLLNSVGIQSQSVDAQADVSAYDILIVGQGRAHGQWCCAGHHAGARRPQGDRVRADGRGFGESDSGSASRNMA